jgi:hypothetical protein
MEGGENESIGSPEGGGALTTSDIKSSSGRVLNINVGVLGHVDRLVFRS